MLEEDAKVADLMQENDTSWNVPLVDAIFNEAEARIIKAILISQSRTEDICLWHYTSSGCFSVKSAYHLAKKFKLSYHPSSSSSHNVGHKKLWKKI